jgi:lysyl endopeptidase
VDINCPEGNGWQDQKRSVVKVVIHGTTLCSGALINNTNQDRRPYVLTAWHCLCNQDGVDNSIFYFNYESSECSGGDGPANQSISGGTFRAARGYSDFSLLELSEDPPVSWSPYYAGWDRNTAQEEGGVGIHHPSGDVKKISTYTMTPIDARCVQGRNLSNIFYPGCGTFSLANEDFYAIWFSPTQTTGVPATTEFGSSGSPLFNNNKKIIGQLHGCDCGIDPYDINFDPEIDECLMCDSPWNDVSVYGKITSSWNGDFANERLRDWLNPENDTFILNAFNVLSNDNWNIWQTITSGSTVLYHATNAISASNTIESGANAIYEAGNSITLLGGFKTENGSIVETRIVD